MSEISQELAQRMADLVRSIVAREGSETIAALSGMQEREYREACAILPELPVPVDPDLIEARRIATEEVARIGTAAYSRWGLRILAGGCDDKHEAGVPGILTAIKRGRELAGEGK